MCTGEISALNVKPNERVLDITKQADKKEQQQKSAKERLLGGRCTC